MNLQSSISLAAPEQQGIGARPMDQKRTDVRRRIAAALVLLSALGYLFSNLAIRRFPNFTVDASHVLLLLAAAACFMVSGRPYTRIVMIWIIFLWLELIHALSFGLASDMEWIKSVAQIGAYSLAFLIITSLKLQRQDLIWLGRFAVVLALFLGGFVILQFALLNSIGLELGIPHELRSTTYSIAFQDYRYQGIARAQGFSKEPSELAFGLVILVAFVLLLQRNKLVAQRPAYLAILVALGGIITTLSPTGVIAVTSVLIGALFVTRSTLSSRVVYALAIVCFILATFFVAPIRERVMVISQGQDSSATARVESSVKMFLDIPDDVEFLLFGTGLGLEMRNALAYREIYQPNRPWAPIEKIYMHNILTVVKFQQGLLGLLTYLLLLWAILHPTHRTNGRFTLRSLTPIIILLIMYLFSSGYYGSPIHWALLALIAVLFRSSVDVAQSNAMRPKTA